MGRKPLPAWTLSDVIELFNSTPGRTLTKRELMRAVNGHRDREAFDTLCAHIAAPSLIGSLAQFEITRNPATRRVTIKMLTRGY